MAKFVGGPYDGMAIDREFFSKFCNITPVPAAGHNRLFLLMPPRAAWERLCRGEITKDQAGGPLYPYERVFVPGGAEFHASPPGAFDDAVAGKPDLAWEQAMEKVPHEEKLAYQLEQRLGSFLSNAHLTVIPPGTLGAGMGYEQSQETSRSYDPTTGVLTITGVVTIKVARTAESK